MDLIRDVLDKQLVDRGQRRIGKVDGLLLELRHDGPPRVAAIEVGSVTLARRLHPRLAAWTAALLGRLGAPELARPFRLPWSRVRDVGLDVEVELDGDEERAFAGQRWLEEKVIGRIPGGGLMALIAKKGEEPERREVRLELLLGRRVRDRDGRPLGRIEEVRAEPVGKDLVVTEYLIGTSAMLERLSVRAFGLAALGLLGFQGRRKRRGSYRVPWDRLDLGDPRRPRLRCTVEELPRLDGSEASSSS